MGDADLRAAERQWLESGLACDEANFVLRALRTLSDDRRQLIASLGCEEARALLGVAAEPNPFEAFSWVEFTARIQAEALFRQLGASRALRVAVAVARSTLPRWEEVFPRDARPREAIEAAEAWLLSPSPEHAARCARRAEFTEAATDEGLLAVVFSTPELENAVWAAAEAEACARMAAGDRSECWFYDAVGNRLRRPSSETREVPRWSEVVSAVRSELLPWLCGSRDPLGDRVAERERADCAERLTSPTQEGRASRVATSTPSLNPPD